jgi:hypothetical protein
VERLRREDVDAAVLREQRSKEVRGLNPVIVG